MGTPEAFAAAFLTAAETGMLGVESPDYTEDLRTRRIGRALRAAGVHEVEILGGGSFGMAGATQDGRVVKLTTDESEVEAGSVLRGQHLPHVVRIDGSWFVRRTRAVKWNTGVEHRVGMLLMERVEPVGAAPDGNAVTIVWSKVRETYNATPWKLVKMNRADARATLYAASKALERQLRDIGSKLSVEVADGLHELRDHKVYGIDVHAGNIGYSASDGVYKLFDIGASSSPDTANPGELPLETETAPRGMTEEGVRVEEIGDGEREGPVENADGTLTLYHATTQTALPAIQRRGLHPYYAGDEKAYVYFAPTYAQAEWWAARRTRPVVLTLRMPKEWVTQASGQLVTEKFVPPSMISAVDGQTLATESAKRPIDPVVVPIDRMYWHGTASRARLLPRRLRGPMWFAKSRHRAVEFGGKLHCFETTRPLQLFPINDSTRDALPMDDSILLPHDRLIDAIRASGYDGSIMYAGDSSEEIMLLEPSRTMRQCEMVNAARESPRKTCLTGDAREARKHIFRRGERVFFEYHCEQSDASCDARLWHHTRQWATVQKTLRAPLDVDYEIDPMYVLRFEDGFVGQAMNDEVGAEPRPEPEKRGVVMPRASEAHRKTLTRADCSHIQGWLFEYLSTDVDPYDFNFAIKDWIEQEDITDNGTPYVEPTDVMPEDLSPDQLKAFTKWLKKSGELDLYTREMPLEAPAYLTLHAKTKLPPGSWFMHFTDAHFDHFTQGATLDGLHLSTWKKRKDLANCSRNLSDTQGLAEVVFGFAYAAENLERMQDVDAGARKYGRNAVIFQCDCAIEAYHDGDDEFQSLFPVCAEYNLHGVSIDHAMDLGLDDDAGNTLWFKNLPELIAHLETKPKRRRARTRVVGESAEALPPGVRTETNYPKSPPLDVTARQLKQIIDGKYVGFLLVRARDFLMLTTEDFDRDVDNVRATGKYNGRDVATVEQYNAGLPDEGPPIWPPLLNVELRDERVAKVTGHEGRHRALALYLKNDDALIWVAFRLDNEEYPRSRVPAGYARLYYRPGYIKNPVTMSDIPAKIEAQFNRRVVTLDRFDSLDPYTQSTAGAEVEEIGGEERARSASEAHHARRRAELSEPAGLRVRNEVQDYHRGETYGATVATVGDLRVGRIQWNEYHGETNIQMIEVAPEFRRQGVAAAMYRKLREESEGKIRWGMLTPDGHALYRQLKARREL